MLPGFGYRFLRQRRQHNDPSTDPGISAIGRVAPFVSTDAGTVRGKGRAIAADRPENGVRMSAIGRKSAAIAQGTPTIDRRPTHQKAGEVVMT